jgi:hypothetical protein
MIGDDPSLVICASAGLGAATATDTGNENSAAMARAAARVALCMMISPRNLLRTQFNGQSGKNAASNKNNRVAVPEMFSPTCCAGFALHKACRLGNGRRNGLKTCPRSSDSLPSAGRLGGEIKCRPR